MEQARLILLCGLPGSGKTTRAERLAAERGAVRLTKDAWLWALGSSPWDGPTQARVEEQLWVLAQEILRLGLSVVLDFGLWSRSERNDLRIAARGLGVAVELSYEEVPVDELWQRLDVRNARPPWSAMPITRAHLDRWAHDFEPPNAAELALFDPPPDPA